MWGLAPARIRCNLQKPPKRNAAEKIKASTCQAAEWRGGEVAAITHWSRDSEPDCWLHQQVDVTHHQQHEGRTNQEQ